MCWWFRGKWRDCRASGRGSAGDRDRERANKSALGAEWKVASVRFDCFFFFGVGASKSTFPALPSFLVLPSILILSPAHQRCMRPRRARARGGRRRSASRATYSKPVLFPIASCWCCSTLLFFEKTGEKQKQARRMKELARFSLSSLSHFLHSLLFLRLLSFFPRTGRDARMRHRRFLLMLLARSPVPFHPRRCSSATASGSSRSSFSSASAVTATAAATAATAATTPIPVTTLASRFAAIRLSSSSALLRGGSRASPGRCASLVYTKAQRKRGSREEERSRWPPSDG